MIEKKLLFAPGPVMSSDRVKKAALAPDICHRRPVFEKQYSEIRTKLLKIFQATNDEFTTVVVSGSGTASNETILSSVMPNDKKVLLISNGVGSSEYIIRIVLNNVPLGYCQNFCGLALLIIKSEIQMRSSDKIHS